jgi:hypothetical protein
LFSPPWNSHLELRRGGKPKSLARRAIALAEGATGDLEKTLASSPGGAGDLVWGGCLRFENAIRIWRPFFRGLSPFSEKAAKKRWAKVRKQAKRAVS